MRDENQEPRTENRGYSYRNLVLWEKSQELTLAVIRLVAQLPTDVAARVTAQQILRSASSMGSNIAEGHGRYSLAAHRNHLSIAKGSACETDNWFDLLKRGGYISAATERKLHENCQEVIRMLTAKILQMERMEAQRKKKARASEDAAIYGTDDYTNPDTVLGSGF